jgi:hypothetical protein
MALPFKTRLLHEDWPGETTIQIRILLFNSGSAASFEKVHNDRECLISNIEFTRFLVSKSPPQLVKKYNSDGRRLR